MTPEAKARLVIDALLVQAGWHVCSMANAHIHAARGVALREFPLSTGFGFADYLLYIDGKAAGVIEAKKEGSTLSGVEVQSARYAQGLPATLPAWRRPLPFSYESTGIETHFTQGLAFDFDGVLADDKSEQVYQEHKSLDLFHLHETEKVDQPHEPGPLKDLFTKIGFFQKLEAQREAAEPDYKPVLRVAIVTARNAPLNERVVTTLNSLGMNAAELFLVGGVEKRRVLEVLKPHIFLTISLRILSLLLKQDRPSWFFSGLRISISWQISHLTGSTRQKSRNEAAVWGNKFIVVEL